MTIKEIEEAIADEVAITKEIEVDIIDDPNDNLWTEEYKEGFIDGLLRAVEVLKELNKF